MEKRVRCLNSDKTKEQKQADPKDTLKPTQKLKRAIRKIKLANRFLGEILTIFSKEV